MKKEKIIWVFLIPIEWQNWKHFAREHHQTVTSYF